VLTERLAAVPPGRTPRRLPLAADERRSLRGRRLCRDGRPVLLQLPRGVALQPLECLTSSARDVWVQVEAAPEPLLVVQGEAPNLLSAAYHLGNRHVALEVRPGELRLLQDPVLEDLLRGRGLAVSRRSGPFLPEPGAYDHGHAHGR
jgi:urease accessory protein